jgi:hypothetical protein
MNTNAKQGEKNQVQKTRQVQRPEKRGQNLHVLPGRRHPGHEQEHPETRMTR